MYQQFKYKSDLSIRPSLFRFDFKLIKEVVIVGLPALVRNSVGAIIVITINNMLKAYSPDPVTSIAIYGIINRTIMFVFMPIFGVLQGMSPIVGYNYGAEEYERTNEVKVYTLKIAAIYFIVAFILLQLFGGFLLSLFGVSAETMEQGITNIRIVMMFIPLVSVQIILSGYYQALGRSKEATFLALLRQVVLLIPLALILPIFFGEIGVWIALPISDLISSLVSFVLYRRETIRFKKMYLQTT
jgi:Na+-driven multidrug efflux pump